MRADPAYKKITADVFLAMDFGTDRRFELSDGVIVMMTGGTEAHAWVQGNLLSFLRVRLKGTACRAYGSDMAVRVTETDVRYPDISIHCGQHHPADRDKLALEEPNAIIEVISPSTATLDQGTKLEEFKLLPSVQTIAFVDPVNDLVRVLQRTGAFGWLDSTMAVRDLELPTVGLTIPYTEIFARD